MTVTKMFIEPVDVWLFRDGRPFSAGSDHRAATMFPPMPSVIQGALRAKHLAVKQVDWSVSNRKKIEEVVGTVETYPPGFSMRGPFLARRDEKGNVTRFFPLPADAEKTNDSDRFKPLSPQKRGDVLTSAPAPQVLWSEAEPQKVEGEWWLSEETLTKYLKGETVTAIRGSELYDRENRFGIGIQEGTRNTREGALYEVEYVRVQTGIGLDAQVNGLDGWEPQGLLRVGGESRGARYSPSHTPDWQASPNPLPTHFKVYFATPTCFENGWLPKQKDWSDFFEGAVELVAAALGRAESVGGIDAMLSRQKGTQPHKPARRYIPAGSVYFFEAKGEVKIKQLDNNAITDYDPLKLIGYGQFQIGGW
jgi:CRISPR-associated protein Cmr3